eukprot:363897-Chlamydomonas_euryale.AAC.26
MRRRSHGMHALANGHRDDGMPRCLPTGGLSDGVNMVPILELLERWRQWLVAGTPASAIRR